MRSPLSCAALVAIITAGPLAPVALPQAWTGRESGAAAGTVATGTYHALLIAVETYADSAVPRLLNPVRDAEQLAAVLTARYRFDRNHVKVLRNPDRDAVLDQLYELSERLGPNDNLVIFFAGHGNWDERTEQGYWLPADARRTNPGRWISNADIRDALRRIGTRHTLVITDACFAGGILTTRDAFGPERALAAARLYERASRKAMTSGARELVPDRSRFMEYVVQRLEQNTDSLLAAGDLFASLRASVMSNSRVTPQYGTIFDAGDDGGDFIFPLRLGGSGFANVADSLHSLGRVRLFQHLLIQIAGASQYDTTQALARIELLQRELARGVEFGLLARTASQDQATATLSGLLPAARRGDLDPAFEAAAWQLAIGEVSGIVATPAGYHLIRRPPYAEVASAFLPGLAAAVTSGKSSEATSRLIEYFDLVQDAIAAAREGEVDRAVQLAARGLSPAYERQPLDWHLHQILADAAREAGRLSDATTSYQAAIRLADEPIGGHLKGSLGLVLTRRAEAASGAEARELARLAVATLEEWLAAMGPLPAGPTPPPWVAEQMQALTRARALASGNPPEPVAVHSPHPD